MALLLSAGLYDLNKVTPFIEGRSDVGVVLKNGR
jgi:hypothetical protein